MKKRRRLWLVASVLLLGAAALVLWAGRKSTEARVALVFIGFTNQPLAIAQSQPQSRAIETNIITTNTFLGRTYRISSVLPGEAKVPVALILATNTGSVPVTLYSTIVRKAVSPNPSLLELDEDFATPLRTGLPRVLKPGETTIVQAQVLTKSRTWRTEFSYQRFASSFTRGRGLPAIRSSVDFSTACFPGPLSHL